jgi:hypothetical protein
MIHIKGGETYPSYNFDETNPTPFRDVVAERNGLPLNDRSIEEITSDIDLALRYINSHNRSVLRQKSKGYQSEFIVGLLDELDDSIKRTERRVASMAIRHLQLLSASERS